MARNSYIITTISLQLNFPRIVLAWQSKCGKLFSGTDIDQNDQPTDMWNNSIRYFFSTSHNFQVKRKLYQHPARTKPSQWNHWANWIKFWKVIFRKVFSSISRADRKKNTIRNEARWFYRDLYERRRRDTSCYPESGTVEEKNFRSHVLQIRVPLWKCVFHSFLCGAKHKWVWARHLTYIWYIQPHCVRVSIQPKRPQPKKSFYFRFSSHCRGDFIFSFCFFHLLGFYVADDILCFRWAGAVLRLAQKLNSQLHGFFKIRIIFSKFSFSPRIK